VLAVAYDLKVLFAIGAKPPRQVRPVDPVRVKRRSV